MRQSALRRTLLATSSALALIIAIDHSAEAATCSVVTNPTLPYIQSGNTCVTFTTSAVTSGNITNTGTVTASGPSNPNGTGISLFLGPTVTGNIINQGTINANGFGVLMDQAKLNGSITNATGATLNATGPGGAGIQVQGTRAAIATEGVSGAITNNGTITSAGVGINVGDVTIGAGIANTGTITALSAIVVSEAMVTGNVSNGGTGHLTGNSTGVIQVINGGTISGSVENFGTITNNDVAGAGIYMFSSSGGVGAQTITGSIVNETHASISGAYGIQAFATNAGGPVTVQGSVTNAGTITAGVSGIVIGSATINGALTNTGTITAAANGIQLFNLATAKNGTATYTFTGGAAIVKGGVTNSGSITSTGTGYAGIATSGATVTGGITNTTKGTITASNGVGILLGNTGRLAFSGGTQFTISGGGPSTVTGGITNAGTITAKTGIAVTGGSTVDFITNSGTITGSTNAINLTGEGAATTINITGGAITGNIVGGGLATGDTVNFNLSSPGSFIYSSAFSAVTTVNVDSGTTLYDNSSISVGTGGVNVKSGATLAPGTPGTPGTLNITGNLAFQSAAIYLVQVTPSTASRTNVSGTATLTGATVNTVFGPGAYMSKQYEILQSGGLVGTFSGVTGAPPAGITENLSYVGNNVFLDLTANLGGVSSTPLNQNQQAVASALNNFFNNGSMLPPGFVSIFGLTDGSLANALSQLSGEAATDADKGAFNMMTQFLTLMLDPFVDGRSDIPGSAGGATAFAPDQQPSFPPDIALAYASVLKAPPPPAFEQRWTAWGSSFGGYNKTDGNATVGSNSATAHDFGFAAGMDYHFTRDIVAGFAFAGGGTNWGLAQGLGNGRSDAFDVGVYGSIHSGPAYLAGSLAFANHWITTKRFAPFGDQLTASFDGQSFGARVETGYRLAAVPAIGVTPYAAVQAQSFHTPSYSETDLTGGGFGLSYAAMNATDTRTELGARFDDHQMVNGMPLILRARTAWAHDWVSNPALGAVFEALPGANFTVNGAAPPANSALGSLSGELHVTPHWTVLAKFDGEFAPGAQTYAGTGTVRYTW